MVSCRLRNIMLASEPVSTILHICGLVCFGFHVSSGFDEQPQFNQRFSFAFSYVLMTFLFPRKIQHWLNYRSWGYYFKQDSERYTHNLLARDNFARVKPIYNVNHNAERLPPSEMGFWLSRLQSRATRRKLTIYWNWTIFHVPVNK